MLPGAGLDLLQLPVELPPQEVVVGLPVNGLQQSRKVYTPRRKVQREVRRLSPPPAQQPGAGVIEGAVGLAVMLLPAIRAQHAAAAHLVCGPVE